MKENKKNIKGKNKGLKNYLKNFLVFLRDNIEKKFGILLAIAILLIAIELKLFLGMEYDSTNLQKIGLFREFFDNVKIILITCLAGIVPYIFAPVVGFFGYLYAEASNFAVILKTYGYLKGTAIGIVPLLLNIVVISMVTALGIYMCKKITVGYRISNVKNMNFLNFRIRMFETIGNEAKVKEYTKRRDEKISKLESKKEKLNYLQIINTLVLCIIIQFVSVLIGKILM